MCLCSLCIDEYIIVCNYIHICIIIIIIIIIIIVITIMYMYGVHLQ